MNYPISKLYKFIKNIFVKPKTKNTAYNIIIVLCLLFFLVLFLKIFYFYNLGTTELYFLNHAELTNEVEKNTSYTFSFEIHNKEEQDVDYTYRIIQRIDEKIPLITKKGTLLIKKQKYGHITESFKIDEAFEYSKILVELEFLNKTQEIHFFVKNKGKDEV